MKVRGVHALIYSRDAEADRAFFRDVLGFPHVDSGGGWLIFKLPPAELGVHPTEDDESAEIYLMCDDISETISELAAAGVICSAPSDQGWGILTKITLPGGGTLGLYQPKHPLALDLP
jgi:predicted enzyme related to lactoylglutathione lyase